MLEIYCDSSYNQSTPSFIGCVILADGREIHQSTTVVQPLPATNLDCELAALALAIKLADVFRRGDEKVAIYNDSTEAVKEHQQSGTTPFPVEFAPRESPWQAVADRLSKRFPQRQAETHALCRRPAESFTPGVLTDIAAGRIVLYLQKDMKLSTNSKTCYRLVIRTLGRIISDQRLYCARAGEIKGAKAAVDIALDVESGAVDIDLSGAYFLLTDETWGLRLKGGESYSILPCNVPHRIICHEVDRSPENLWRRVAAYLENK